MIDTTVDYINMLDVGINKDTGKEFKYNLDSLKYLNPAILTLCGAAAFRLAEYILNHVNRNRNVIRLRPTAIGRDLDIHRNNVIVAINNLIKSNVINRIDNINLPYIKSKENTYVIHPKYIWNANGDLYYAGILLTNSKIIEARERNSVAFITPDDTFDYNYWIKINKTNV